VSANDDFYRRMRAGDGPALSRPGRAGLPRPPPAGLEAFIWDPVHGMQLLQNVLTQSGANLDGWTLNWAQSVSDNCLTIAGGGTDPAGHEEGWVATIPLSSVREPSSLGILLSAVAAFALRRKHA